VSLRLSLSLELFEVVVHPIESVVSRLLLLENMAVVSGS
jgi:hypothetical protein